VGGGWVLFRRYYIVLLTKSTNRTMMLILPCLARYFDTPPVAPLMCQYLPNTGVRNGDTFCSFEDRITLLSGLLLLLLNASAGTAESLQ
jgi:hypothetical protein